MTSYLVLLLTRQSIKIDICHATASHQNPYIINSPDRSGDVNGHDGHNGVVWYPGIADHSWGDIIPPFDYVGGSYPGKNWTAEGQAIYNNGCNIPSGTLTVTKTLIPANDPGLFNLTINGTAYANNIGNGGTTGTQIVTAGSYTVGETAGTNTSLADYLTTYGEDCDAQGQVTVGVGETKSCTITNTRRVGEITLLKQVIGGTAVPTDWEFEVLGVGTFQNGTFVFNTGSYSVTEMTDVLGYSMTGVSGSCSSPNLDTGSATLTVTEQGGTCTFTNTRDTGSVKVNKLVDTNGDNQYEGGNTEANNLGFTWSLDGVGANAMGATVSNVPTTIPQVSHLVNESLSTAYAFVGWYITSDTSRSCLNPTGTTLPITVQVVKGQTAEITLCNQRSTGTITIIKDSQPNNAQNFSFTTTGGNGLPGSFLLDDDNNAALPRSRTYNLPTGQYAFTEGTVGGWQVTDIQCSDENSLVNLDTRRATVNLDANEQVTCIFTNTQLGRIAGLKFNDKNGNGQLNLLEGEHGLANWQIFIDQNNNSLYDPTEQSATTSSFFLTYGAYSFNNLLPGDYTVCETMQAGWYNSTPLCQNVTLGAGDAETVFFGNHRDLTIRAYKIVCDLESDLPNWGHGAPNITASTASSYVANNPGCRLAADWEFEYGYDRQVSKYGNGDQLGTAGDPWMSMGTTNADGYTEITLTDLQGADGVWVREALKENYVPFSYPEAGPTEDNYSAELYCHQDGQHYDNYDQVDNIQFGKNYYCVAFNALNTGDLEVTKYHDLNGDGNQDDGEPTLQGWEINLEGQSSENTDSEGKAHFSDLLVGNYSLSETLQEGWVQTKISCDQEEAEREPEMQALVQLETDDLEKNPFHPVTINPGQTTRCLIGNQQTPVLTLTKANDAIGSLGTGSQVLYTLTVNLTGSNLTNVILTDLPPTDFSYQSGSWTAASDVRGDLKLAVTTPEPTYASPGTWQLGDMTVGETVTLSYIAKIGPDVEPGTYRDLAWVAGSSAGWGKTLANQSSIPTTFVGTEVTVDRSLAEGRGVDVIQEGEVLGASTYLPATGSDTRYLILALGLLFAGLCLFFGSAILSRGLLVMALLLIPAFSAPPTYAADDPSLSIRLESPKTPTRLQNQKLAYSVLSTDSDTDLTIRCYAKRPGEVSFTQFGPTQTLAASGNSGNCELTASLVSARGTYEFYVTATDSSAIAEESSTVTMFYENEGPGTPHSYSKDHPSICRYVLKFKTADDSGRTTSVEIYRSQELSFTAGPGTFVGGLSATSNTEYSYVHDFGSDCDKTWYYAVRAFDSAGNGSGVVGDTITTTASSTSLISTPSALTLQTLPTGVILGDKAADSSGSGEVEGAETTIIESSGLVDDLTQVFANRPWWHYALTGASLILLLFLLYRRFKRQ